mmetsp:Transcript_13050/g.22018  ORF Transcript_13050/g.22018 Transcript_13050/m.22018 type:complete len:226 (-) Transcript_13050:169-846(-)
MHSSEGADLNRKFFKNTDSAYLMQKCKNLEKYNIQNFLKFISVGKTMVDLAEEGKLEEFKKIFVEADDKELMFWHVTKSFKAAIRAKRLSIIEFIIEDIDMPLNHEAFKGLLQMFVFQCQEAEMQEDPDERELGMEVNRQILRYLVKGHGRENMNPINKANGSTPLIMACEYLTDPVVIEILVDGGAEVNAVDNDDNMPLKLIKGRMKKDPDNYDLQDIFEYLKR